MNIEKLITNNPLPPVGNEKFIGYESETAKEITEEGSILINAIENQLKDSVTTEGQETMKSVSGSLKDYFENTPKDQIEKDWKDGEKWDSVGVPVQEFVKELKAKVEEAGAALVTAGDEIKNNPNRKIFLNTGTIGHVDFSKSALSSKQPQTRVSSSKIDLPDLKLPNPEKGNLGDECYRTVCEKGPALYYNKSTKRHYCVECAEMINGAVRADAYRLFGAELCELDTSLTPSDIMKYEDEYDTKYPSTPVSLETSQASLTYRNTMNSYKANMSGYDENEALSKEDKKYTGKAVPVTPKSLIGRNDPCSCGSGKKFKKCCQK